jgi:hypothetical protein
MTEVLADCAESTVYGAGEALGKEKMIRHSGYANMPTFFEQQFATAVCLNHVDTKVTCAIIESLKTPGTTEVKGHV